MAVRRYDDLIAWQRADDFKRVVTDLVLRSPQAGSDLRYRQQLLGAASAVSKDIAEGFVRYSPATFMQFLDYALASLVEAEGRLRDGIERRYLDASKCREAFSLARRCFTATIRLKRSQHRYLQTRRRQGAGSRGDPDAG